LDLSLVGTCFHNHSGSQIFLLKSKVGLRNMNDKVVNLKDFRYDKDKNLIVDKVDEKILFITLSHTALDNARVSARINMLNDFE
jgi:hypothetical protein